MGSAISLIKKETLNNAMSPATIEPINPHFWGDFLLFACCGAWGMGLEIGVSDFFTTGCLISSEEVDCTTEDFLFIVFSTTVFCTDFLYSGWLENK